MLVKGATGVAFIFKPRSGIAVNKNHVNNDNYSYHVQYQQKHKHFQALSEKFPTATNDGLWLQYTCHSVNPYIWMNLPQT